MSRSIRTCCILPILITMQTLATSADEPPASNARIQFAETTHNFGRLLEGTIAKHGYSFTNTGNAELVITHVVPSCGCTTTPDWTPRVSPGGKGSIPLEFNTHGMIGEVQKSLAVHTNDPDQPVVVLLLGGTIWKPLELHPPVGVIHMPPNNSTTFSTTIRIVNQTDLPLKLDPPASSLPELKPRIQEITPGKEYHLVLDLQPPAIHQDLNGTVTINTSSAESPKLSIPVIVIAQPEILVTPNQLFLPAVPPDFPQPYVIRVTNQGKQNITLDQPACDAAGAKVEIRETTPGREFELAVTFPPDFGYVENQTYSITARTSNPQFPEIRILVAFAKPPTATPSRRGLR